MDDPSRYLGQITLFQNRKEIIDKYTPESYINHVSEDMDIKNGLIINLPEIDIYRSERYYNYDKSKAFSEPALLKKNLLMIITFQA